MAFNPSPDSLIEAGDVLITLGHRQQLDRLEGHLDSSRHLLNDEILLRSADHATDPRNSGGQIGHPPTQLGAINRD